MKEIQNLFKWRKKNILKENSHFHNYLCKSISLHICTVFHEIFKPALNYCPKYTIMLLQLQRRI